MEKRAGGRNEMEGAPRARLVEIFPTGTGGAGVGFANASSATDDTEVVPQTKPARERPRREHGRLAFRAAGYFLQAGGLCWAVVRVVLRRHFSANSASLDTAGTAMPPSCLLPIDSLCSPYGLPSAVFLHFAPILSSCRNSVFGLNSAGKSCRAVLKKLAP